jgi:hypothetical protein
MSTGAAGGAYHYFGERYREKLAQDGIEVELRPSSGAVENLRRLKTDDSVDLAFIQGGIANEPESEDLATLGSMYLEPVWVFYRGNGELDRVAQLRGRRIAVGLPGSGAQLFALQLLAANGFATNDPQPASDRRHADAVDALKRGEVDAFFVVGAPQAPVVNALLHTRASNCSTSPRPTATDATSPTWHNHPAPRRHRHPHRSAPPRHPARGRHRQPGGKGRHPPGHRHPAAQARPRNPQRTGAAPGRQRLPPAPGSRPAPAPLGPALLRQRPALPAALPALLAGGADRPPVRHAAAAHRGGDSRSPGCCRPSTTGACAPGCIAGTAN